VGLFLAALTTPVYAGPEESAIEKVIKTTADTTTNFPKDKDIGEELAVEKVIKTAADAVTNFPKDKDIGKVLSPYAGDYERIEDGARESLQDIRKALDDIKEQLDLGRQIGISNKVSNIKVHVAGGVAWATYAYTVKIGSGGEVVDESAGLCTAVLAKKGHDWKIVHDHCSSPKNEEPPSELPELSAEDEELLE